MLSAHPVGAGPGEGRAPLGRVEGHSSRTSPISSSARHASSRVSRLVPAVQPWLRKRPSVVVTSHLWPPMALSGVMVTLTLRGNLSMGAGLSGFGAGVAAHSLGMTRAIAPCNRGDVRCERFPGWGTQVCGYARPPDRLPVRALRRECPRARHYSDSARRVLGEPSSNRAPFAATERDHSVRNGHLRARACPHWRMRQRCDLSD